MHNDLASGINSNVSGANAQVNESELGTVSITVDSGKIKEVLTWLRDNDSNSFNSLQVISALDWPEYFEVNYMLCNFDPENPRDVMIKVKLSDKSNPNLESVCDVYKAANFQEREAWDMMGVEFNNHPDQRRILCPDDWEGHPLRKDYVVQEVYNGMTVNPENKMNWDDRLFKERQDAIAKEQKEKATTEQ